MLLISGHFLSRISDPLPQVLDQVVLLLLGESQLERPTVVIDDVRQGTESTIMVEATFVNLLRIEMHCANLMLCDFL